MLIDKVYLNKFFIKEINEVFLVCYILKTDALGNRLFEQVSRHTNFFEAYKQIETCILKLKEMEK